MPWRPRASSIGYYTRCTGRAFFDRAIADGILADHLEEEISEEGAKPYAALGTCIHFELQDGLRCEFPGPAEDFAYSLEDVAVASELFGGDITKTKECIRNVATEAAAYMPAGNWLAESSWSTDLLSGHIDFLRSDYKVIIDLKTTARRPIHNKAKPPHVVQLFAYRYLVGTQTGVWPDEGVILYADSLRGKWIVPVEIDFTSPEAIEYQEMINNLLEFVNDFDALQKYAMPQIGSHCSDDFCPHTDICRKRYMGYTGRLHGTDAEVVLAGAMTKLGDSA